VQNHYQQALKQIFRYFRPLESLNLSTHSAIIALFVLTLPNSPAPLPCGNQAKIKKIEEILISKFREFIFKNLFDF